MVPLVVLPVVVVVGVWVDEWCPVPWTWEVRECDSVGGEGLGQGVLEVAQQEEPVC